MSPTSNSNLIVSAINLMNCFLDDFHDPKFMEAISDLDVRAQLEGAFFFSMIWTLGAVVYAESRPKFDMMFRGLLEREFPASLTETLDIPFDISKPEKPYIFTIPTADTVYDYRYIKEVSGVL